MEVKDEEVSLDLQGVKRDLALTLRPSLTLLRERGETGHRAEGRRDDRKCVVRRRSDKKVPRTEEADELRGGNIEPRDSG